MGKYAQNLQTENYLPISEKPGSQLYQFLLMLLEDATLENKIQWVDSTNHVFRIIDKEWVAQMWGEKRDRPSDDDTATGKKKMTYDSLSRALRYYYQHDMMASVRKKMHYKFTQKCMDEWDLMKKKNGGKSPDAGCSSSGV